MNEQELLKELGSRIRLQRKQEGITQEELALRASVDRSYFGGIERGERNITFTVLCRVCAALRCDVAALTGELPPKKLESSYDDHVPASY